MYQMKTYSRSIMKRALDIFGGYAGLILFSPIAILVAILIRLKIGSPVLFKQERLGLYAKPFIIYKFRTMTDERDKNGNLLADAIRLKSMGKFLRKMSIDELPELLNVIKGQMSLVGPRPLLKQYLNSYTPEQSRRHEVKPGITGWAQIHGRNNTPFSKRFAMDVWYVDNQSLWLDIKIIALTVLYVFKRENIRSDLEQCYSEVNDCGLPDQIIAEGSDD